VRELSINNDFQTFIDNIEPTPIQKESVEKSIQNMQNILVSFSSPPIIDTCVFGSHVRNTKIRPLHDADILAIMDHERYKSGRRHLYLDYFPFRLRYEYKYTLPKPENVLNTLRRKILNYYTKSKVKTDRPCVVAYLDLHNIEIVPAFRCEGNGYLIPNDDLSGWIETYPHKLETKLLKINRNNQGQLIPFVKMIKKWRDKQGVFTERFLSYKIEEMACEMFPGSPNNMIQNYPQAIYQWFDSFRQKGNWAEGALVGGATGGVVGFIVGGLLTQWILDITRKEDQDIIEESYILAKEAYNHIEKREIDEAKLCYNELFGSDFPR
jgi:predicted nucleotidyltransferase